MVKVSAWVHFSVAMALSAAAGAQESVRVALNIEPQPIRAALKEFGQQTGLQVLLKIEEVSTEGVQAPAVEGQLSAKEALEKLLATSDLTYEFINARTIRISEKTEEQGTDARKPGAEDPRPLAVAQSLPRDKRVEARATTNPEAPREIKLDIPEILVTGSKSLNADIRRTRDGSQPYVVFNSDDIATAQASSIEEFLNQRLPMDTTQGSPTQNFVGSNRSEINLRGLGSNQTLILIDGRRLPGPFNAGGTNSFAQPDLNGIPMAAIERIEILPSTASGIYGGGATGGVINVILKRDYAGYDLNAEFGNSFDGDVSSRRIDLAAGFNFDQQRTSVMLTASHASAGTLLASERDFAQRSRALIIANSPELLTPAGAPPLGSTPNICNADAFFFPGGSFGTCNSNPLFLDNGTPLGSAFTSVPAGYSSVQSDGGQALVGNAGQYNLTLPSDQRSLGASLLTSPEVDSASLNVRRSFNTRLDAFVDFTWSRNQGKALSPPFQAPTSIALPADAPNNPFNSDIAVTFPNPGLNVPTMTEDKTLRGTAGVVWRLTDAWSMAADYGWGRLRSTYDSSIFLFNDAWLAALNDSSIDVIRDANQAPANYDDYLLSAPTSILGPIDSDFGNAVVRISGPIGTVRGAPINLSGAVERRSEDVRSFFSEFQLSSGDNLTFFNPERSQDITSYYVETVAPLVSNRSPLRFVRSLQLQAAVRHDKYETRSVPGEFLPLVPSREGPFPEVTYGSNEVDATKYTLSLAYSPIDDLVLRASRATGFLPPSLGQIVPNSPTPSSTFLPVIDPRRGNESAVIDYILVGGGNTNLEPEESEGFSFGVVYSPRFAPSARLSIDYTRIKKVGEIAALSDQQLLNLETSFPDRVTRGPNLPGDEPGWAGPVTGLDLSLLNASKSEVEAYDFALDYEVNTARAGQFRWYSIATLQNTFTRQFVPGASQLDFVGFNGGPLKWKGVAGLDWSRGPISVGWNAQFFDGFAVYSADLPEEFRETVTIPQGSERIPSQIYHDVFVRYRFSGAGGWLDDTQVLFGVKNIFGEVPPITASPEGLPGYSTYGDPRMRRFALSFSKHFDGRSRSSE
jgi:iron complex outermembrane recepter protein